MAGSGCSRDRAFLECWSAAVGFIGAAAVCGAVYGTYYVGTEYVAWSHEGAEKDVLAEFRRVCDKSAFDDGGMLDKFKSLFKERMAQISGSVTDSVKISSRGQE